MKCSKKKILVFLIATVLLVVTVIACVLLAPKSVIKNGKRPRSTYFTGNTDEEYFCHGKECSEIRHQLAEEAIFRKSCSSEECVLAAARMIRWMDKSVNPCDDFYNFSCGNFIRSNTIPEGWDSYGSVDVDNEEIELKIKSIVEEPIDGSDSDSLKETKKVYRTCLNLSHIEETSVLQLGSALSSTRIGEWPFLKPDWKDCRLDLEWRMAKLNALGIDSLFRLETEFQGDEYRLLAIMKVAHPLVPGICDDSSDNVTEALEKASEHKATLLSVLELLEVSIDNVTESDVDDVFQFDFFFCNATKMCMGQTRVDRGQSNNRITLMKLADIAPQINWIRWRNIIFSTLRLNFPHDKQSIYADGVEHCIGDINSLLSNTTSKVLANYLTWKFVFHHLGFLGKSFRQILEDNQHSIKRETSKWLFMHSDRFIPRWRQCVIYIKELMPMGILKTYYDIYHRDEVEKTMDDIVTRIKQEFRSIMKDTRDLLENDRLKSSHKIDKVQVELAYPTKENKYFSRFYSGMGPMSDSFLENGMKLMSIRMRKLIEGVSTSKTINDMEYAIQRLFSSFDLNTYSFFKGNSIIVTLGHLQAYSIMPTFPKYKTMATFGWMIGHELTHGFDLQSLNVSSDVNWTWWPSYVLKQALKKVQCFQKFLPVPVTSGKGSEEALKNLRLNEDMCDHQGMYLAFKAYLNYLNKNGDEEVLPGIPLANEKLFFVSYAQQFCEIRRDDSDSIHSPGRLRVNQVLKNLPAFSESFRCPINKPMNSPLCVPLWT